MNVEERLRVAMHAVSDDLRADDVDGLTAVRTRGRAARRRRALLGGATVALTLFAVSMAVTRVGGARDSLIMSGEPSVPATAHPRSTVPPVASTQPTAPTSPPTATSIEPSTVPTATAPQVAASVFEQVMWPGPGHVLFDDPVAAARSFVEEFIGFDDAPMGAFRPGGADIGTVDVHNLTELGTASENVMSTITMQRFDGHWYVIGAVAVDVQIDSPGALTEVTSPVRVEGRAQGYESTVVVEVRDAFSDPGERLGQTLSTGGSNEGPLPFFAQVALSAPSRPTGVIIASTDSGIPGGGSFAAIPVRFAPTVTSPGEVTALRVFFPRLADGELVEVERTVPETTGVLRASLVSMLDGPTEGERAAGLTTRFPLGSGAAVEAANLNNGLATVRLSSRLAETAPPPGDEAIAQLNATVFQFGNVQVVRYEIDGSCDAFDAWLNQGCEFNREADALTPASSPEPAQLSPFCLEEGLGQMHELQAAVDAGHRPFRLSAEYTAAACTLGIPGTIIEPAGENTYRVTMLSTGRTVVVTVAQPVRSGPGGAWIVTSVDPPGRGAPTGQRADAPCTAEAILPVVRQQLFGADIIGVFINECQNGYARVAARFDTSRCGNDGTCGEEAEQVFLVDEGGAWSYLNSGTGITCDDELAREDGPGMRTACEALGLS